MKAKPISYEDASSKFYYDESSKSCLRSSSAGGNSRIFKGKEVAYEVFNKNKEFTKWVVPFKGSHYSAARIVWVLHNNEISEDMVIDHIDGNPRNNKIGNLRLVDKALNGRNQRTPSTNSSGHIGVSLKTNGVGHFYWCAHWKDAQGNNRFKNFSVLKLGYEKAKLQAIEQREKAINALNVIGVGYHKNHGRVCENAA